MLKKLIFRIALLRKLRGGHTLHKLAVKAMVGPFVWANRNPKQTVITRAIRAAWRAL